MDSSSSGNGSSNGSSPVHIPKALRVVWCITSILVTAGFPIAAMICNIHYGFELTTQWVSLYIGGLTLSLFGAFGIRFMGKR